MRLDEVPKVYGIFDKKRRCNQGYSQAIASLSLPTTITTIHTSTTNNITQTNCLSIFSEKPNSNNG
jgi:hypothetical protein